MNEVLTYLEQLRELALDQHGFVSSAQAVAAGIPKTELPRLASRGRISRVGHGIYRISQVPSTQYENLALALLETGVEDACISHDTALAVWEICDINSATLHISVPQGRRIRRSLKPHYEIHRQNVQPSDAAWWQEIPLTSIAKTIGDCIVDGTPTYLLRQAIVNGAASGMLSSLDQQELTQKLDQRG
ncbi:type IV toxin-antitoxin system AbiEi family antitoxin domain-containing protein [Aurantimicrobium minutum]|uniref:type IV toxin-antitoxin system AbiEi family antitoxin domain-containing protein n=1 Tax=Aurantimicrobium minutum TaxID=708131 RepID=UPI002474F720|nr:type IV toxin-antitoxin system AbiEi family antitoxin domain-containing protein [Aurantimicrobium minutum]